MTFVARLDACVEASGSLLCCGLDPDGFASAADAERRCLEIVEETEEHIVELHHTPLGVTDQVEMDSYAWSWPLS